MSSTSKSIYRKKKYSVTPINRIDEIDELFSSSNRYKQLFKFIQNRYENITKENQDTNPFRIFFGLPFYRFDLTKEQHIEEYDRCKSRCCFNHFIGMPEKHGKVFPFFEYEKIIWEDFEKSYLGESDQRLFAVLKATGIGMTEFLIRIMAWMATSSNRFMGKRFAIIAGIRQKIAEDIITRFINLFSNFPFLDIRQARAMTIVNGVLVEAYPAINLDSMRSFHNLQFVFVDEADFFRKSLQKQIRKVIERYIAKTNPYIYLISTPGQPNGLMYELFRDQTQEQCIYKRYEFGVEWGEGTIFTKKELDEQRDSDSFEQEYNLKFGGSVGNLLTEKAIMRNVYSATEADKFEFFPYYTYSAIKYDNNSTTGYIPRSLGLDPGFGKNPAAGIGSYTGLCLTQYRNNRIEILYAEELKDPEFDELVEIVSLMVAKTGTTKLFVDGSNPPLIKALKKAVGEYSDYHKYNKTEMDTKIYSGNMIVCPVPFNIKSKEMLHSLKEMVDKGLLVIHEKQINVIDSLRSATVVNEKLDKEATTSDDLFDALRLSLNNYRITPKMVV